MGELVGGHRLPAIALFSTRAPASMARSPVPAVTPHPPSITLESTTFKAMRKPTRNTIANASHDGGTLSRSGRRERLAPGRLSASMRASRYSSGG